MYLPERDLILHLLKDENYKTYYNSLDLNYIKDNHRELHTLYVALKQLHERFPNRDHGVEAFRAFFFTTFPDVDRELFTSLFETLERTKLEEDIAGGILKQIKQRSLAIKLSEESVKFATGYSDGSAIKDLASRMENPDEEKESIETVSDDLEFILDERVRAPGLRWRLQCLNKSLGSLRKANFGFIFARPETGKTTFLASECSYMLEQLKEEDGPIIWFNNEQAGAEVMLRMYQGYFGVTLEALMGNPRKFKVDFLDSVRGKFKLVDDANIDRGKVEKACRLWKPSLVIFDQIDKVKGFQADRDDLKLGNIYIWARELAKEYCPVIGVCQAGGEGEGVKWLTMEHVANAKTSKQAEADWILGIGKTNGEGEQNLRYLNISKNKLHGDTDSLSDLRHGRFETYMEELTARYKDIVNYE